MSDKLSVTLETPGAEQAIANVRTFKNELISADAQANKLKANSFDDLAVDFDKVSSRLKETENSFSKIAATRLDAGNVGRFTKDIVGAADRSRALQGEIARIQAALSKPIGSAALKQLRLDLAAAEAESLLLGRRLAGLQTVAGPLGGGGGRPGHNPFDLQRILAGGQLRGAGPLLQAAGARQFGIDETIFNVANQARLAAGISTAGLATFGAIAAAGFGLIKISEHLRDEAKKRLGYEEAIAIAANKQIISAREQLKTFREADALRAREQQTSERLARASVADRDSLQKRIDLLKTLRDIDPTGKNAEEFNANIQASEQRLNALNQKATGDADAAFAKRNEDFKAAQAQRKEFEKQQLADANAARQKIGELGKDADALFAGLFAAKGENNPFVRVFSEAEQAIERTRVATSLLSKDLQTQAADLVAAQNANALFGARLDARISAVNLRADAAGFRGGGLDSTRVNDAIVAKLAKRHLTDNFEQLAGGGTFNRGLFLQEQRDADLAAIRRRGGTPDDINAFLKQNDRQLFEDEAERNLRASGQSESSIVRFLARSRVDLANGPGNASVSDRLDKQLAALNSLQPGNAAQRTEVDRRIIALTQGLRPEDLTEAQRNAAATARENEAVRAENAEADAKAQRAATLETQKSIDANIADLLKLAKSEGLQGVIRIINEAEDRATVSVGKRPTPRDATQLSDL